jgi:hypothetical protein
MAALLRAIGTLAVALAAILLGSCAGTPCEEWVTRVEPIRVCGPKGMNCTVQNEPVRYCVRKKGERVALPDGKEPVATALRAREETETRAPEKIAKPAPAPEPKREAPPPKKTGKADQAARQPKAQALDRIGMPNLTPFWQSLFSASRYPGLRYGRVKKATMGPTTTPASSPGVEAALKTRVRSVVSMEVASDARFTPMDHRLDLVVYRAHNREAAVALYAVMMREEWRDKKHQAQPGVTLAIVKTDDKNNPDGSGQRVYLQRGPYVLEVDEWKSVYRDAKGKPVPGKQFRHTGPISPDVVAKAVIQAFPAE